MADHASRPPKPSALAGMAVVVSLLVAACSSGGSSSSSSTKETTVGSLPSEAQQVVDSPTYEFGSWNWDAVDLASGDTVFAQDQNQLSFLGSTTKLFTTGTYLDQVGADSTLSTPVYAIGDRSGGSLRGSLVLVGSGDFILGSRGVLNGGDLQWKSPDHVYAYASPLATPVAADPLAGLDELAAQVKASGITSLAGDVLVDERLWDPYDSKEGVVTPATVNDNLLDIQVNPGAAAGDPTDVGVRPQTGYFTVDNRSVTSAPGGEADLKATIGEDGHVAVTGELPAGSSTYNLAVFAPDPGAYVRALFIEALQRAGVQVNASLTAATTTLPAESAYTDATKVASLTSPPAEVLTTLVTKTSHNRGAETLMCLLAVKAGSKDCEDGLKTMLDTIGRSGVDPRTVFIYDGEGTDPASATPAAMIGWLTWANSQPWIDTYRTGLPDLNNDGTIMAKSGTSARPQIGTMPSLFVVSGEAGYMTTASGKNLVVAIYAKNGSFPTVAEGLDKGAAAVREVATQMQKNG